MFTTDSSLRLSVGTVDLYTRSEGGKEYTHMLVAFISEKQDYGPLKSSSLYFSQSGCMYYIPSQEIKSPSVKGWNRSSLGNG